MEQYMEQCKNISAKFVLDKQSLFCYAGDQHKLKGNSQKGYGVATNDRS